MQDNNKLKRLAISCGGTGGHFYPGLSIARELQQQGGEAILILSGNHVASQTATAEAFGLPVLAIKSSQIKTIFFPFKLTIGILQAIRALNRFRPDALLAMGSFASFTAAIAAKLLGIPVFLHDGNARIGKSNRLLSYLAKHLGVAFPPINAANCHCPYSTIGMPLRLELLIEWNKQLDKSTAIELLNKKYSSSFDASKPTLLIFGGSQGAQALNEIFPQALKLLNNSKIQVIHLTGAQKFASTVEIYHETKFEKLLLESSPDMALFYRAADVVICRSGGSTVAELLLFGKFAFLIPYPYAAERHQDDNANYMASSGAAEIIYNDECTVDKATAVLSNWLTERQTLQIRGLTAQEQARPNAGKQMLEIIYNSIDNSTK
jgi:UDP-N-acetylglucosamine--N-acetylmuramyl-(pentapeptide) pyrophosphoryl-undecaprenol N-acetylglucosamine transferase